MPSVEFEQWYGDFATYGTEQIESLALREGGMPAALKAMAMYGWQAALRKALLPAVPSTVFSFEAGQEVQFVRGEN